MSRFPCFIPTPEALGLVAVGLTIYELYRIGIFARLGAAASNARGSLQPAYSFALALFGF
jgi:hypothetical protein